jgi:hypothetical protein
MLYHYYLDTKVTYITSNSKYCEPIIYLFLQNCYCQMVAQEVSNEILYQNKKQGKVA